MFFGGAMARSKIESVVGVHTVGCGSEAASLRDMVEDREEFVLAIETAVGGVGAVGRIFHFMRFYEFVMKALCADEIFDDAAIVRGIARRQRGYRERAIAHGFLARPG